MGFHYPFFTFGDWLWSVVCFLVVALIVIWLVGLCVSRRRGLCGDCGFADCICDKEDDRNRVSTPRRRTKNSKDA